MMREEQARQPHMAATPHVDNSVTSAPAFCCTAVSCIALPLCLHIVACMTLKHTQQYCAFQCVVCSKGKEPGLAPCPLHTLTSNAICVEDLHPDTASQLSVL